MMISLDSAGAEVPNNKILRWDHQSSRWLYLSASKRLPTWLLLGLEHSGNGLFWIPAALVAFLWPGLGWRFKLCALNLEAGFLLDLIIIGALKLCFKRLRPAYADRQYTATVIADEFSFPSGHSSRCTLIAAMVLVFSQHQAAALVWLAILWALATSVSRVLLGRHYVSDVAVGGVLGVAIAAVLTKGHFNASSLLLSGRLFASDL